LQFFPGIEVRAYVASPAAPLDLNLQMAQMNIGKPSRPEVRNDAFVQIFEKAYENILNNFLNNPSSVPKKMKSFRSVIGNLAEGQIAKFETANRSFSISD
jgi:hypothetical protein